MVDLRGFTQRSLCEVGVAHKNRNLLRIKKTPAVRQGPLDYQVGPFRLRICRFHFVTEEEFLVRFFV